MIQRIVAILFLALFLAGCENEALHMDPHAVDVRKPLIEKDAVHADVTVQPGAATVNSTITTQQPWFNISPEAIKWLFNQTQPLVNTIFQKALLEVQPGAVVFQPGTVTVNPNAIHFEIAKDAVNIILNEGAITLNFNVDTTASLWGKKNMPPKPAAPMFKEEEKP